MLCITLQKTFWHAHKGINHSGSKLNNSQFEKFLAKFLIFLPTKLNHVDAQIKSPLARFSPLFSQDANPFSTYPIVKSLVVLSALQRWRPDDVVFTSTVRIHRDELRVTGLPPNLFTTAQRFSSAPNSPLVSFRARSLALSESSHWHTNTGLKLFAALESLNSHTLLHHCREKKKSETLKVD